MRMLNTFWMQTIFLSHGTHVYWINMEERIMEMGKGEKIALEINVCI